MKELTHSSFQQHQSKSKYSPEEVAVLYLLSDKEVLIMSFKKQFEDNV